MQYTKKIGEFVEVGGETEKSQLGIKTRKLDKIAEDAFVEMLVAIIKKRKNG